MSKFTLKEIKEIIETKDNKRYEVITVSPEDVYDDHPRWVTITLEKGCQPYKIIRELPEKSELEKAMEEGEWPIEYKIGFRWAIRMLEEKFDKEDYFIKYLKQYAGIK